MKNRFIQMIRELERLPKEEREAKIAELARKPPQINYQKIKKHPNEREREILREIPYYHFVCRISTDFRRKEY